MPGDLKQFIESRQSECKDAYQALLKMGAWEGWYKTLSALYPDNAHFVFELLQNAEDANATKVKLELLDGMLTFRHDGTRDFNKDDVYAITNVGDSKKGEETNKIGKFGVGFKSVFAYTTSPKIYSKTVSFEIKHLFIPSPIDPEPIGGGYTTIFKFPFDREDKSRQDAFNEINALFDELSDNVLLFLTNIHTIEWQLDNSKTHKITKETKNEFVEIKNSQKEITQWLVFSKDFEYKEIDKPLTLSIAFKFNKDENLIEPVRGDVSIFFPAKKETSKLKFHINAPFSSTVARDSIVDSSENNVMMEGLAALCRESMHKIRDQFLLKPTFFEILPNVYDELDVFYQPIFKGLVDEFSSRENKLIPLKDGSFGSIYESIYCSKKVNETFVEKNDVNILFNKEELDGFAITPIPGSRFEDFLASLDGFVEYEDYEVFNAIYEIASNINENSVEFMEEEFEIDGITADELKLILKRRKWLEAKSNEYLQSLYAYLYETIENHSSRFGVKLDGWFDEYNDFYSLLKCNNGKFNYECFKCYFIDENSKSISDLSYVHPAVFSSGKRKKQQQKAKAFLERIGVEDVDESTHIEYLFHKYKFISEKDHLRDINKLVSWYIQEQKSNPNDEVDLIKIDLHKESFVNTENSGLLRADQTYIDDPYHFTGLRYIDHITDKNALNSSYKKLHNTEVFIEILTRLGSVTSLEILSSPIHKNPDWRRMWRESKGLKETHTSVREDWNIEDLSEMLEIDENKFEVSLLVWNTVSSQARKNNLSAKFRMSQSYDFVTAKSSLIFYLMAYEWIPDNNGNFYKPEDIDEEMLADEFSFHGASLWLDAVDFGKNILIQKKEYKQSKAALTEWNISLGVAEKIKNSDLTNAEIEELINAADTKKLKESLKESADGGSTHEVSQSEDYGSIIINPEGHQANVAKENKGVSVQKIRSSRNISRQDSAQLQKINSFLYEEYSGHCQICGDTFQGNQGRNIFITHSLNKSKKGDRLKSDVNRKGNSICLCPKHHLIFSLNLQAFDFMKEIDKPEISLTLIEESFEFRFDVGKGEDHDHDGFYYRPEGSSFRRDVFMLPIRLFSKCFYLKFTQDHIQHFVEVWNNN